MTTDLNVAIPVSDLVELVVSLSRSDFAQEILHKSAVYDKYKQAASEFMVIRVDEKSDWKDRFHAAKHIWSVYLVDMNECVNMCELATSNYCHFLYATADTEDESIAEDVSSYVDDEGGCYMHTARLKAMPDADKHVVTPTVEMSQGLIQIQESYDELLEHLREHYGGNHVF